jgi:TetR/AcrR family transcriptional regulator
MNTENTEEKIFVAAEEIFLRDGYAGSRMQDIADLAGINKALLHYYFRSKDKLFEKIFDKKASIMFPRMEQLFEIEMPFTDLLCIYVEKYMELLIANPFLPLFIITTVNKPNGQDFIQKLPFAINRKLIETYSKEVASGKVKALNPLHFVLSIFSMCAFPFMAKPVLKIMANANDDQFKELMQSRVAEIQGYIRVLLKP